MAMTPGGTAGYSPVTAAYQLRIPVLLRHSRRVPVVATEPLGGDTVMHATALIAAFLAAIALAGCGSPHTTTTAAAAKARTSSPAPPPAASAAASAAAAPSDTAPPDPWQTWCSSQAYVDNEDAVGDANATVQDVNSDDYATAATDGATLEMAALKAGAELPPAGSKTKLDYGLYFGWLAIVGKDLAAGDVTAASGAATKVVKFRPAAQAVDAKCTGMGD
jgi:hypothetical protein